MSILGQFQEITKSRQDRLILPFLKEFKFSKQNQVKVHDSYPKDFYKS